MKMEYLNTNNLQEKTSQGLVLVDFFATWCGPCKMIGPVLEQLDNEVEGLTVYKIDVDENPEAAAKYGVQSIPNLILFKDGEAVDQIIGFTNKEGLLKKINPYL
ncbi:thioredoxin [Eggerthia catenaformis]|nr:thioredoxin [Eggerthia catenaformis]